jgi:glycosyltransferase involved in cell wall biosynthesis
MIDREGLELPPGVRVRHIHFQVGGNGGPHGYLGNLSRAAADLAVPFDIRPLGLERRPGARDRFDKICESIPGLRGLLHRSLGEFGLRFRYAVRDWRSSLGGLDRTRAQALVDCDLLFVHDVFLAEELVRLVPQAARERVVLVSHAPTWIAHQIAATLAPDIPLEELARARPVGRRRERELATCEAVRAVLWPYRSAQAGYPGYAESEAAGRSRSLGVVTGVPRPEPRTDPRELRRSWGIDSPRVALFMGRAHPDKGFHRFVAWAAAARGTGWTFAFAGEDPKRWTCDLSSVHKLGYQNDNGAAYLAADLVLMPNRNSYLDIGLLEGLALGVPIATTATGGHRDVLKRVPEVIEIPEGEPERVWPVLAERYEAAATDAARQARRKAWQHWFSPEAFVRAHVAASRALLENRPWPPE